MRMFGVVYAAVAAYFLIDVAAADRAKCEKASGSFTGSCEHIRVQELNSAPFDCMLSADCPPLNRSLNHVYNEAFYPRGIIFTGVTNENGTLHHNAKPWSNQEICTQPSEKPVPNVANTAEIQRTLTLAGTIATLGLFM